MKNETVQQPSTTAIMTHVEALRRANARACFAEELKWLGSPQARGRRNMRLCAVARCGLNCGLTPEQVVESMQSAGGRVQPLTEAECRRAMDTVLAGDAPERRRQVDADWSVVPEMIRIGRDGRNDGTFEELARQSQEACGIAGLSPREQAETMLDALGGGLRFFCDDAAEPRDRSRLAEFDERLPERVTLNALTGKMGRTKAGRPSLVCDETAKADFWLVEFDGLPLEDQMNWLAGNVSEFQRGNPAAFDVVTGVHSGGRSLHFAIRSTTREKLERYAPQADSSVWHPSTLTRLAGAVRHETGQLQRLIYCAR